MVMQLFLFDTKDLAEGITWVLDHPSPEDLRKKARTRILNSFDTSVSAAKYADLSTPGCWEPVLIKFLKTR